MRQTSDKREFEGHSGARLAARLDLPNGPVRAYALFAHCFTCTKDLGAVRQIVAQLACQGIAVLRFDFTGLGASEGDFAATNFTSNLADLERAADYMREHLEAPAILIGHSLGGAAVLGVARRIDEVRAVVTIGAPANTAHVLHNFGSDLDTIEREGAAEVALAGRRFTIEKQFVEDVRQQNILGEVAAMRKPLLVLHAPLDGTVGIENAGMIFQAARHPKSFISLDTADHLLTRSADAAYAGRAIAGWVSRYLPEEDAVEGHDDGGIGVSETGLGRFQNNVRAGPHRLLADEPQSVGGLGSGPSPYDFLAISLAACTSMTLRMYAGKKAIDLGRISVDVRHDRIHATDCDLCSEERRATGGYVDRFTRRIAVEGELSDAMRAKISEIADKCPVHRTLTEGAVVETEVIGEEQG